MRFYLSLLFLFGIQICLGNTITLDSADITTEDYLSIARTFEEEKSFDKAIDNYEYAKAQFIETRNDVYLVFVLNKLATLYTSDQNNWEKAHSYLDTANIILDEKLYDNDTLRALTWVTMGGFNIEQRKFNTAIGYYQKALKKRKMIYGEIHLEVADLLESIGGIYLYDLQNPYSAKRYYEQFIKIRETLNQLGRPYINGFYSLASANRQQGDYEKALAFGHLVRRGYDSLEDVSIFDKVIANSLLGNIYYDLDSIDEALNYNRDAITFAKLGQLTQRQVIPILHANQARFHFRGNEYDSTIYYANLALKGSDSQDIIGKCYQFLGNAYWKKEMLDEAFQYYQKSKNVKESLYGDQHTQLATLYVDIARAYATAQQTDSALYYFIKGFKRAKISKAKEGKLIDSSIQASDDLETIQEALHGITDLLYDEYQLSRNQQNLIDALPYFQLFDRFMELSRSNFSAEGSKLILSANFKQTYGKAIAACYELYQTNQSDSLLNYIFQFMEKSKAMVLMESIHKGEKYESFLPDSLIQREQSLRAQLAYLASEITEVEQKQSELLNISDLQAQKAKVLQEIDLLNQYIATKYPNFHQLTSREFSIDIDSVRQLISENQSLISYYWGDSTVYALMISRDRVILHKVSDFNALQSALADYQGVLVNDDIYATTYTNFLKYQESAHKLFHLLLEPVLKNNETEHLIIVLDGFLTTIPFESLITSKLETQQGLVSYEKLPYLLKEYEVSYEFSASIAFWDKQYTESQDHDILSVVAFGIKNFDQLRGNLPPLGGAEREISNVKAKFPDASIFLNDEATESRFKQNAPEADILHIATHGIADFDNPFASHFIFFPDSHEDGTLNLYELYNLPLQANLLFLTACNSGIGKHFVGEGNFSLARSFVYAGCKSVLMSLWQVDDIQTEQLINRTYDQLVIEPRVSKAIRNAKLDMINEGTFAHPQCWAGMVPLGNTNLTYPEKSYQLYYLTGLIIVSLIVIYVMMKRYKT